MILIRLLSSVRRVWILSVQFKRSLRLMKEGIGSGEKVRCGHVLTRYGPRGTTSLNICKELAAIDDGQTHFHKLF